MSARLSIKDVSSVIVFTVFLKITAEAINVSILVKTNRKKKGGKRFEYVSQVSSTG